MHWHDYARSEFIGVSTANITITAGTSNAFPQSSRAPGITARRLLFAFAALVTVLMAVQLARQNRRRLRFLYAVGFLLALVLSGISGCGNRQTLAELRRIRTP